MSIVTVDIPSPHNVLLYFLKWQVRKDNKLGIMTNVGKNRLVKVIFTNVQKISDACASSFGKYIIIAQCIGNVFTFYYTNSNFSGKIVFLRKPKLIYSSKPQYYSPQLFSPHLLKRAETMYSI